MSGMRRNNMEWTGRIPFLHLACPQWLSHMCEDVIYILGIQRAKHGFVVRMLDLACNLEVLHVSSCLTAM